MITNVLIIGSPKFKSFWANVTFETNLAGTVDVIFLKSCDFIKTKQLNKHSKNRWVLCSPSLDVTLETDSTITDDPIQVRLVGKRDNSMSKSAVLRKFERNVELKVLSHLWLVWTAPMESSSKDHVNIKESK